MGDTYVCPRCGNRDPRFIGFKGSQPYCRKCVSFRDVSAPIDGARLSRPRASLSLPYELSPEQKCLSEQILSNFQNGVDTLIYAVCGSGKTEISYRVIEFAMKRGMHVGFALPRRDVVIELHARLQQAFPQAKIIAVYGDHASVLEGDCLVLTTHQLYRYPHYFDLLVMDEIDAFPFKGNEVLIALFRASLRGHCVMMSATPSKEIVREFKGQGKAMLTLHTRFHKHPIPVPHIRIAHGFEQDFALAGALRNYGKQRKPCFVFVPSVRLAETLWRKLSLFLPQGNYVSSQREGRAGIIEDFKQGKYAYLVTTAVLERGITVRDLQVIVYHADSRIYDAATLIQIAGRAGRKSDAPDGDVLFLADHKTKAMEGAVDEIRYCNSFL